MKTAWERFDAKHEIDGAGCWVWTAGRSSTGYGVFWLAGAQKLAHRLNYERHMGPIPDGLQLDHLCRNRACVNPAHLEPVDVRTNLLRGETLAAQNAAKTHCPKGHEYTARNTKWQDRRRYCRACLREQRIRRQARRSA